MRRRAAPLKRADQSADTNWPPPAPRPGRLPRGRGDRPTLDLGLIAEAERAIEIVFNYDLQAITDAFYYDQFASLGVDLRGRQDAEPTLDLSDCGERLRGSVHESLRLFIGSSQSVHGVSGQLRDNVTQTTDAMAGIAANSTDVAEGAERQAGMIQRGRAPRRDCGHLGRDCASSRRHRRRRCRPAPSRAARSPRS